MVAALKDKGIPYDIVQWDEKATPRKSVKDILYGPGAPPNAPGKYRGLVFAPNLEATGAFNAAEVRMRNAAAFGHGAAGRLRETCSRRAPCRTAERGLAARAGRLRRPGGANRDGRRPDAAARTCEFRIRQVGQIWDYQIKTGARANRWNVWPATMGVPPNTGDCSSGAGLGVFTAAAPLEGTGVARSDELQLDGLYRWGGGPGRPLWYG